MNTSPRFPSGLRLGYRAVLVLLAVLAAWSLWAAVTEATNAAPPAAPEPQPGLTPLSGLTEDVLTFGLNHVAWLQGEWLGQPLWKYLASVIYLLLAFYSSKFINWFIVQRVKRWAARTQTRFDDLVVDLIHGPIKVVSFVIFLHIGLRLITWSPWISDYLSRGLRLVVAWSITYMVLKGIDLLLNYWRQRAATHEDRLFNEHLYPVIRKSARVLVVVGALLLTADNLGFKVTSILAGLSIGGLALGLAAQDTVANLFGAVAIFLDKPFQVGDRIVVEGIDGTVEAIGLRSTRVRNLDGHLVAVPNKTMGNAIITNISKRPTIKTVMNIGLTYDTPAPRLQRAAALLEEIYRKHPMTADVVVSFDRFADSSLNIKVVHWWNSTDWKQYMAGMQALNLEILERFNAEGLSIAYPTQTLYVKTEPAGPPAA
ncbi:MAG TPA: mechanosensitive ion channel family protein [Verrucomicrobiota bacterium]|nr:mechanosensitive ion channel family protein [Verrucomicrobiota bacterium]HNU49287.1 mechanosensitive ion channel family protein [Verrucomicrobiota bacterium]